MESSDKTNKNSDKSLKKPENLKSKKDSLLVARKTDVFFKLKLKTI